MAEALAFWVVAPGRGELRREPLPQLGSGDVLIEALASGISRGTETTVFQGRVPESQHRIMRAPHQAGEFTFPVKYGYGSVGIVAEGPEDWLGRRVFCLHPHQDRSVVPRRSVILIPASVTDARAVLAANMETVVNALWDAAPRLGDRVAVVGAGVIGALAAALAARMPGAAVQLVDVNPDKAGIAAALGVSFALPGVATPRADLVIHASGTAEGLATALDLAAFEATVVELSWYGDRKVAAPLGEAFHSRRLRLVSSQVGTVATAQRARWDRRRRLALALDLLADPRFDVLLEPFVPFARLPEVMAELAAQPSKVMCQVIDYRSNGGKTCSA
jgi:NADPH:quinone reductase-like Zn-dependent oxidoreductase